MIRVIVAFLVLIAANPAYAGDAEDQCATRVFEGIFEFLHFYDFVSTSPLRAAEAREKLDNAFIACSDDLAFIVPLPDSETYFFKQVSGLDIAILSNNGELTRQMIQTFETRVGRGEDAVGAEYYRDYLHTAAYFGSDNSVRVLLDAGYEVDTRNEHGQAVLHNASGTTLSGLHSIRDLVRAGADVNATGHHGETPIMMARQTGDLAKTQCLLALGAALPDRQRLVPDAPGESSDRSAHSRWERIRAVDEFLFASDLSLPGEVAEVCTFRDAANSGS